ncbi:MAG: serine/threonine-protein kinase [Acidobacteria bacterium]|nr:serine/threonine-protein kinase [Acidobacteriota bacterium]
MTIVAGTRFGPYEIRAAAAVTGLGELYAARDHDQQRDVAFRVLRVDVAATPGRLARFERESHAAARLEHPNLLRIYDIGTDAEAAYVVSEPIAGRTLDDLLRSGPLPPATVSRYMVDLASGLAAAHSHGIVHRDLTPANILVTAEGVARIVGLGLASATQRASVLADGHPLGALSYMTPEQIQGATVGPHSDMFAFGAIAYEMLTGTRAFGGGTLETISAVTAVQIGRG